MISNIFRRQSLIAILCTISLLACYFVVPPAAAAGSVTLTIDTVPAAAEGTIVTIPITASEVGDIVSFGLKIDYNRTKLEFAGWDETGTTLESIWNLAVTKSTLANVNASSLKPAVAYVNGELSDISTVFEKSGTGILAKIKFKVLAAGANNTIPVSLSPGDTTVDDVSSPKTVTLKDGGLLAADTLSPQFTADYPKPGNPQSDGSRQVRLLIDVLEDVEYYYVVLPDGVGDTNPPTASQIIEKNYDGAIQYKNGSVTVRDGLDLDTASILPDHNTAYDFWIVIADDAGNASVPVKLVLATPPAADLFVAGYPKQGAEQDPGSNQIEILVETQNTEGNAIVHYVAVLAGEGAPTIDQIGAGKDSADNDALLKGNIIIPKVNTDETKILLTLLEAGTDYDIYMVAGDAVWAYPSLGTCSEKVKLKVTTPRAIGTDASVKGVIVDGAAATVDAANPAVYAVELPYGTVLSALTAAKVVITTTDSYATVATPTTTDGGATWTVLVTAEDGTTTKTYTINITVASPPIPPAYASTNDLANPTVEVANATTETAAKAALDSTVGVLGTLGENGTATISWSIADYNPTAAGDYTATGVLTLPVAWTGSAPNLTATVTVLAPDASDDASVKGVTVDGAAAAVNAANPTVYDVELPYGSVLADLTAADVVVTATDSNATVATPTTTDGGATWTVEVTAQDGTTTETYTINVTVASMMPATIADLTISKGTLRPAFDPDTYYYRASVANSVTSVTIAADELEDMVVSGDIGTFNLAVGDNTFEIYVDGGATHVDAAYTIVITRARGSSDGRDNSDMVITKNGGSVGQQGVSIQFPEGAVDEKIIVTIADVSTKGLTIPEGSRLVSDIFKINSDYDEDLDEDITIRLPFDLNEVDKSDDGLGLYRWDGDTWVILDNIAVNWSTGTIKGDADQFGKFAVLATALTPPVTPVTPLWDIVGHWAESAIRSLVTSEAISGYPDGTFRPDNTISRAEFASIIVKAFNIPTDSSKLFADTAGHWAQEAIASAYAAGIIAGYDDMSFGPDDPITREQMAVMIVKAKGLVPDGSTLSFNDQNSISPWASESVAAAAANQLISGYPDNTFRGGNFATRAEAVMVITQALK